ncbi:hypothetical protein GPJ56_007742 [Histomonas meleagridis]|uniref:uncharacterized protein n=1 Tax=Histomonas meleagridis TaxID=135588 RepID=UPI00355A02C7|nr:hypothetical protein GPJ56_007742 [Histomonas meleagridis]KAH0798780.1 hypothetical protein GO595_008645 [Histomonas meleagridis]
MDGISTRKELRSNSNFSSLSTEELAEYHTLISNNINNFNQAVISQNPANISNASQQLCEILVPHVKLSVDQFNEVNFIKNLVSILCLNNVELVLLVSKLLARIIYLTDGFVKEFPVDLLQHLFTLLMNSPPGTDITYLVDLLCNFCSEISDLSIYSDKIYEIINSYGQRPITVSYVILIHHLSRHVVPKKEFIDYLFFLVKQPNDEITRLSLWVISSYCRYRGCGASGLILENYLDFLLNYIIHGTVPEHIEASISILTHCIQLSQIDIGILPIPSFIELCHSTNQIIQYSALQFIRAAAVINPEIIYQCNILSFIELSEHSTFRVLFLIVWIFSQILASSSFEFLMQLPLEQILSFIFSKIDDNDTLQYLVLKNLHSMKYTLEIQNRSDIFYELMQRIDAMDKMDSLVFSQNDEVANEAQMMLEEPLEEINKTMMEAMDTIKRFEDAELVSEDNEEWKNVKSIRFVYNKK